MNKGLTLLMLGLLVLLSGCWDQYELEDRANILGIAVDLVDESEIEDELEVTHKKGEFPERKGTYYKVTAQIAVPGKIKLGPEGGSEGSDKTSWIIQTIGHTMKDAMAGLQQQLAERLYLGHLQIVIVSDEIAEKGIEDINDYLGRNPQVRRTAWMVINEKDAAKVLQAAPPLETVPALYVADTLDNAVKFGKLPREYLGRFWIDLSDQGIDGVLPAVKVVNNDRILVDGIALFNREKMVERTSPIEIGVFMGLKESNAGGYSIPVHVDEGIYFLESQERKNKIKVNIQNGQPNAKIKVEIDAEIEEQLETDTLDEDKMDKIEKEANKQFEKIANDLIKKMQEKGTDPLGIGARIRGKYGSYWDKEIKTDSKWLEVYKNMDIKIDAVYTLRRAGIRSE